VYKPQIDGLRGISILLVIACHLNFDWAKNGYLGVDIFFVISGYLIIGGIFDSIMASNNEAKFNFKFANFYFRRARRIIPVAVLVQICVLVYSYFFTNSLAFKSTIQDFKWSSFFLANFHFAQKGTDYFQSGFSPSPLLHFWSLSIEEQFYVVFPITFLLTIKFLEKLFGLLILRTSLQTRILFILCSLTLLSFLYDLYIMTLNPTEGYYSSAARFWEITLGGIVYIATRSFRLNLLSNRIKILLFSTPLFMVVFLWKMDHTSVLKQFIVVIPVSIYLLFLPSFSKISWFLNLYFLTFVGKISYSLYLWHWPVFTWVRDYSFSRFTEVVVSLTVTALLSVVTWKVVETPFRKIPAPNRWL
jgi:peptidoglycan/LPS O-acetylase OafA/YrhL